jgi:outer membrane protein assembly factor BamB
MVESISQVVSAICVFLLCSSVGDSAQSVASSLETSTPDQAVTYQINAVHTGISDTKGLVPPLQVVWSVNLKASTGYALIAEDKVFVLAGDSNLNRVDLYALRASDGNKLWGPVRIPEGAYWWAAAAYDNGVVYVVPDSTSGFNSGAIYAFNAQTGKHIWTAKLPGQYLFSSPPTVGNGMVYTAGAGVGGTVYAVSQKDGSVVWTQGVANGDDSSPVVTKTGVFVSYVCPQTYDFKPTAGTPIWHYQDGCDGGGGATMALYRGLLYVRDAITYPTNNIILKASNGSVVGSFNTTFIPSFLGSIGFYTTSTDLEAVDLETSNPIWTAVPPSGDTYASPPIVVNGTVYIGTGSGLLLGYNGKDGAQEVSISVGAPISASDYENFSSPLAGLSAAQGLIVVPASTYVVALRHK